MSKNAGDKKRRGFREFYEDEENRPKKKRIDEKHHKDEMRFRDKLKKFDPKNYAEDDFDDDFYNN